MQAPLSSPSLAAPSRSQTHPSYFTPSSTSAGPSTSQTAQQQAQVKAVTTCQQQHQQQCSQQMPIHTADTTSPFLRDFNLVAEAAKRAQMAVLMRDMEGVGLS